jgi:RNA polymerase sigma-70 factor (ECF subfamily)
MGKIRRETDETNGDSGGHRVSMHSEGAGLLQRVSEGSYSAFERFYEQYADMVYRIALLRTKDPVEAEDVCHDVFLEVLNNPEQYDASRGSIEAWLAVKTKSRSLDRLRRKQRVHLISWEKAGCWPLAEDAMDDQILIRLEAERVRHALQAIPAPQQRALMGAYFEERTHRELAETLGRPLGTVKTLIRSGLQHLRRNLENSAVPGRAGGGESRD